MKSFIMTRFRGLAVTVSLSLATVIATPAFAQSVDIRDVVNRPLPDFSKSEIVNPDSGFYKQRGTFAATGARRTMIEQAARGVGIRAGFAVEAEQINAIMFQRYRSVMDRRYNFQPLLLQGGDVIPPVVTKINSVRELPNSRYLYSAQASYEIVKEPRLSTMAPSWMDYVLLPVREVRPPDNVSFEDDEEKSLWREAARAGWEEGIREARLAFVDAFNVLDRDYQGMILFRQLASQGFVSVPRIDIASQPTRIDANGRRAYVNERVVRIVAGSRFQIRK
jgi:defect-in-organelle-trafficking protein DotC